MTTQHHIQDSPEKLLITEKRPPELAMWELPYKGLHRHKERDELVRQNRELSYRTYEISQVADALNLELKTLKINYQHALDKVTNLAAEVRTLRNLLVTIDEGRERGPA